MAQALFYSSNAVAMTLSAGISSGDTTCSLSTASGLPASFPFKLLIGWSTGQQEVVHCTALSGTTATISRGQDGTTAQAHSVGDSVVHGVSAREFNDLELHVGSTSGVHGVSGAVVGTTDTQTLTNKTQAAATSATVASIAKAAASQSADTWQVQDSTGTPLAAADKNGHIGGRGLGPTATAGVAMGTSPPAIQVNASSYDQQGNIQFGTGTSPAAFTDLLTVTFARPFTNPPRVIITPCTPATTALNLYVAGQSTTAFTIRAAAAPPASQPNTAFVINYIALG